MKTHKSEKTARSIYFYQRVLLIFSFLVLVTTPALVWGADLPAYTLILDGNNQPVRNTNATSTAASSSTDSSSMDQYVTPVALDGLGGTDSAAQSAAADSCEAKLQSDMASTPMASPICTPDIIINASTKLEACYGKAQGAAKVCLVDKSTIMRDAMPVIGGVLTLIAGMKSMTNACAEQSKLMTYAKDALAAYNTACGAAKLIFTTACDDAKTTLTEAQVKCPVSNYGKALQDVDFCKKLSGGYSANLITGGLGIVQMVQSALTGNACTQATTNATVDCTQAANANNLTCVCMSNPNASGCASANGGLGSTAVTGVSAPNDVSLGGAGGLGNPVVASTGNPGGQSLGSGGPTGSGGGSGTPGSGVGGAGSGTATPLAAAKEAGLNNAAGGAGGGGGGYGGGAGGGWADGTSAKGALAGKINSIARNPAAQISGKAGKSNWDKVNNVYLQMSTNLMK